MLSPDFIKLAAFSCEINFFHNPLASYQACSIDLSFSYSQSLINIDNVYRIAEKNR